MVAAQHSRFKPTRDRAPTYIVQANLTLMGGSAKRVGLFIVVAWALALAGGAAASEASIPIKLTGAPHLMRSGNAVALTFAVRPKLSTLQVTIDGHRATMTVVATGATTRYVAAVKPGRMRVGRLYVARINGQHRQRPLRFAKPLYLHANSHGGI
jgi:hypothetical protein